MPYLALFLKQGLGKSKIGIDTAVHRYLQGDIEALVIISRNLVIDNWQFEEIPKHLGVPHFMVRYNAEKKASATPAKRMPANCLKIVLMNEGTARTEHGFKYLKSVMETFKCALYVDESTLIKNPTAQITKKMLKLAELAVLRRIMCGEPAPQGAVDYFSQYKFLSSAILGVSSFTAYKNIYCQQEEVWVNGRCIRKPTRDFNGPAKDIFEDKVKGVTIRLRKEDVLTDLPPKQYIVRKYQLPAKVRALYDKLASEYMTELVIADSAGTLTATMAMGRAIRLHQMVSGHVVSDTGETVDLESGRFEVLCDILDERPTGSKTIIWAHYRHTIDQLTAQLEATYGPGSVRRVYGDLSERERQECLTSFKNKPEVRFLVANPATAGWGLTLTEADTAIYYSNSYNWEHRDQSEDRIHRIGQQSDSVTYYDLVAVNTVDERILEILQSKAEFSKSVLTNLGHWFT